MYTKKILNEKDTGIYLDGKLVCICPIVESEYVLWIRNYWLQMELENVNPKKEVA